MALPTNEMILANIETIRKIHQLLDKMATLNIKYRKPFFTKADGTEVNLDATTDQALITEYQALKASLPGMFGELL